jgi:hypothetical protein
MRESVRAVVLVAMAVLCSGFVPVGGCAKGCGRVASHQGDDIVRVGVRSSTRAGDNIAIAGAHYSDDLVRGGTHYHGGGIATELEQAGLELGEQQSKQVSEALGVAQDIAEEAIGQLLDDDGSDDDDAKQKLAKATVDLDATLQRTLTVEQLEAFHAKLGTARDIVDRLTADSVRKRASSATQK